ncbi:MAG: aminopeptidase N [Nocardioides sp.]
MPGKNLTRDEAAARAALLDVTSYAIDLDLTTGDKTFDSTTTLRFTCREPGAQTFADLVGATIDEITLNGRDLDPTEVYADSRIALSDLEADNELVVRARCPYSHSGEGLHRFVDPADDRVYLYTQFEVPDARRVYTTFEQPDLKSVFTWRVTAPADWAVVSNAPTPEPEALEDGAGTAVWTFPESQRMATYITALIAGEYHQVHDVYEGLHGTIPLGHYCRQSLVEHLDREEVVKLTRQGFEFFEDAFDFPYPFEKYDQLYVPEYNAGAMENAGAVTLRDEYLPRSHQDGSFYEFRCSVILHEMAHMWFGDLVTMRWWDDLWLNESFATYQGTLSLAEATRFSDAWTRFAQGEKAFAYAQDQLPTTHPITADIPDIEATHSNFDGITYSKGASVLRQLVAWVGRDSFDAGIKAYFQQHEWGNTELEDFLAPLEQASGRDLKSWSEEWLQTAGVNTFTATFETGDDSEPVFKSFSLAQSAPQQWPTLRSHRIGIGLYDDEEGKLVRRKHLELDAVGGLTDVAALEGEKVPALVLVNDEDLTYAKTRLDPASLETVITRVGAIENPLARALCWASAWEMVRDAEMPARDYLQMILRNIQSEADIGIVQTLLAQAQSAINVYGDPQNRPVAMETLADAAVARLHNAEPGSDLQRAWAEAYTASASTEPHFDQLRALLAGDLEFEGLAVDISLRWSLVGALVASGAEGPELIDAEGNRDPTDEGHRYAVSCRVSRPIAEAKALGWEMFTREQATPLATLRAAISGFLRYDQVELIKPYVEKYFETVREFWGSREPEVARAFASGLFPRVVVEEPTVELVSDFLEQDSDAPYGLARILMEGKDGLQRALRARAKDAESGQ